ncbi:uncharacterized protein LOC126263286 [Schistocerca nitens]|uniref:uncharacterized protein LOC126263286 n=1 Tax=Schistocerca nitens TaxID=7011 RepID=UPI002117326F|nr:uncharacterized protein LOC126263286 [Schistocerca nitens]
MSDSFLNKIIEEKNIPAWGHLALLTCMPPIIYNEDLKAQQNIQGCQYYHQSLKCCFVKGCEITNAIYGTHSLIEKHCEKSTKSQFIFLTDYQGVLHDYFPVSVGVHQGPALSPLLSIIIMDMITRDLQKLAPWTLLYADDVILATKNKKILQQKV